ncbi:MAG TPA: MFS transporter [Actinomycetes bacterium]|nr:MFS transporter [Actinomycetes bacterium]
MSLADLFRRTRIDTTPLRTSRDFRLLFVGGAVSYLGSMITFVALPYQLKQLTGSFLQVGALGAVEVVPLVVCGLWGGALADALDRRRVVLATEFAFTMLSVGLVVNAMLAKPRVWPLYAFGFVVAALGGLQRPSLEAMVPRIVAPDQQGAAAALASVRGTIGSLLGPAIGGLLVATAGPATAYAVDVVSFAFSLACLALMRATPPPPDATTPSLRSIAEGIGYAWSRKDLLGTYVIDLSAMFFAFPFALFPFIAADFHAVWALGLLYTAPELGSLVMSLTSGWSNRVHHHGRAIVYAAFIWGSAIGLLWVAHDIWVVLVLLCIAGGADMVSALFRMQMWNQTIPDELRGRLAGIELLSYSVGPSLGQTRSGVVARYAGLRASLGSGGVSCCIATVLLAISLPALWAYDVRTSPEAAARRKQAHTLEGLATPGFELNAS